MKKKVFAVDPGNTESGWCVIEVGTRRPLAFGKSPNDDLLRNFTSYAHQAHVAIEMVASYGMAVGADVFETCVWIGRFVEASRRQSGLVPDLVKRSPVKLHHCRSLRANDSNIRQALVDRFAHGERNHGKGTKDQPGWFHGFRADIWQAYALAVYIADANQGDRP